MKRHFRLTYTNNIETTAQIAQAIKEKIELVAKYNTVPEVFEVVELILTDEVVQIENTDEHVFTKKDKKNLLNIFKKEVYIENSKETNTVLEIASRIIEEAQSTAYNEKTQIGHIFEALYAFSYETIRGYSTGYIVYGSEKYVCDNIDTGSNNGIIFDNEYILYMEHVKTNEEVGKFLKDTSYQIDIFTYKYMCKRTIENQSLSCYSVRPYRLYNLYAKIDTYDGEEAVRRIEYGIKLFYDKQVAIKRLLGDSNKVALEKPSSEFFNPDPASYDLLEEELRVIVTVFHHKDTILKEISMYCYMFNLFKYISSDWEGLDVNSGYFMFGISNNHRTLMERCKKKKKSLMVKIKKASMLKNNIIYKIEEKKRKNNQNIDDLTKQKAVVTKDMMELVFKYKNQVIHCKYLERYKDAKAVIVKMNRHIKSYILDNLKINFQMPVYENKHTSKMQNFLINLSLFAVVIIICMLYFWLGKD